MSQVLQSFIGGQWIGQQGAQALRSAINGQALYQTHAEAIDFGDAVHHARTVGLPNLLKLDFQERAQRLKALAKYLGEHKEQLYAISAHTGATRADSWVDIEGGAGTLFAYAGIGSNELPSGNLIHEGPAFPLWAKKVALRARTSWCRAAASRCTSTPSTSPSGAFWKSSRPAFWRACRASANRLRPPAT
jgi:oxepin-CoA hydrolase / 3-oxo-5,6-dehydrosuberyl-CoA semialdehyde dehydrogenase